MAISTIYEVSKPTYQFYSVERSGYTDVGTMVTSVISDMTNDGKFEFKTARLTDVNNFVLDTPEFPILERIIEIVNPGIGYRIGNLLELKLPTGANIKLNVSNVVTRTGAISNVSVVWPGNYEVPAITSSSPNGVASYALDWQPINANLVAINTVQSSTQTFMIQGNVTSSVGTPTAVPAPLLSIDPRNWGTEWGANGEGGTLGSKWPATGIWFQANIFAGAFTQRLYSGQLIELDTDKINSANSVIPAGTTIVSIVPMKYINGTGPVGGTSRDTKETLGDGTYVILSNPVTLRRGDSVIFKGTGARFKNDKTQPPKAWQATVEAQGAVDPLNDPLGVTGDIRVSGTNSQFIEITSISNPPGVPYRPRIHEGQSVTSTALNGSIGPGDNVFVSAVTMNAGGTIANVQLSRPLSSFTAGETLQFKFDQMQPWRMAFDVKENTVQPNAGPQTVVVYAATELQLQDNGNIANIYLAATGSTTFTLTDRSGILGSLPTGPQATPSVTDPTQGFINRAARVQTDPEAYPFNYALTMTDRGIFWGVWEGTWSTMQKTKRIGAGGDSFFNWVLIQRPVNRNTGKVLTKGRAPVFCINSVGYQYWKFILREEDVLHPTTGDPENKKQVWIFGNSTIVSQSVPHRVPADANTQDSFAVMNTTNQVALTEDSKYLVSFLHNLSTPRFRYSEELDIIGQTSADVCMAGTDISITAYNETGARTYRALPSNNPYNTGLRISVLRDIPQVEP
jgi:hypothetical protein